MDRLVNRSTWQIRIERVLQQNRLRSRELHRIWLRKLYKPREREKELHGMGLRGGVNSTDKSERSRGLHKMRLRVWKNCTGRKKEIEKN